ncbi:MAG: hypothetical protein HRT44_00465 [Bdellovibrionales bacterium]|nr:hypothetical protein [Bdellovibrionales bacterium]NQZ17725.1 hypothetical protein [Bdellovibrionales bacterium]
MMNSDYTYLGGNLAARVSVPHWKLSPYVGFEGYLGDHKNCTYQTNSQFEQIETCEKVFLASAYSELGLRLNIKDSVRLYLFTRGLSKIDQTAREDLAMFYGFSILVGNL